MFSLKLGSRRRNQPRKELDNKYILMILCCKKYIHKMEEQMIHFKKKNVLQNMRHYYLIGDKDRFKDSDKEYLFSREAPIIYTNTEDDYLALPHKSIIGMKALYDNFNFEYLLKTDDDQRFVGPSNFLKLLDEKINKTQPDYLGLKLVTKQHPTQNWKWHDEVPREYLVGDGEVWSNGRFYGLSRRNLKDLLENKMDMIRREISEDWGIAKYQKLEYRRNFLPIVTDKIFVDMEIYNKINKRRPGGMF
jgi:hypothetical protein